MGCNRTIGGGTRGSRLHSRSIPSVEEGTAYALAHVFLIVALLSNLFGLRISGTVSLILSGIVLLLLLGTLQLRYLPSSMRI
ncbi:hypothetical protein H8B09_09900 [Paenibacillus sp. PR3]|uniref:Uncharacterized protein n=1 Tax=Paenibacillus terricola TaxID=2763503 RepID=A0ABR8MSY3_9BACL|nr:hypothetical protein [Paenibacillus terricola]MBD3919067.1 hypothetical protein [Paenibacillus terricola]